MGGREASLEDGRRDSDALVSDIRDTRRSIDSTLEQLGEAMKPSRLLSNPMHNPRVRDTVHRSMRDLGHMAENTRYQLSKSVKERPVAAGILAAGVVAAMFNVDRRFRKKSPMVMHEENKATQSYRKYPMIFGAGMVGIGALVGMAFPPSRLESVDQFDAAVRE